MWSSAPFALNLSSCSRRRSAGADLRASGREREMGSPPVTHPPLTSEQRSRLASGRPCLVGLDLDRRASNGPLLDGRLCLETVDAAEGVENACRCISRAHEGVQIACRVYVECVQSARASDESTQEKVSYAHTHPQQRGRQRRCHRGRQRSPVGGGEVREVAGEVPGRCD